jgi:hypothetical protein
MHTLSARLFRLFAALSVSALVCSGCYDLEAINATLGLAEPAPVDARVTEGRGQAAAAGDERAAAGPKADRAPSTEGNQTSDGAPGSAPADTAPTPGGEQGGDGAVATSRKPAPPAKQGGSATSGAGGSATASDKAHGAGRTGPSAEACTSNGTQVGNTSTIAGSGTALLKAGTYGSLKVPPGATVKPYDCGDVTIAGTVSLGNGATLAGVTVRSDARWVIRIGGHDITVRNSTIQGGSVEAVRIHDNARNVTLVGNNLDGGRNNHVVKVKAESGSAHPDAIVIDNNVFSKRYYSTSSEDLLQLEGHRHVTVTNNTFANNPSGEDGVDVKQGTEGMVMRGNRFLGGDINSECLLVQGGHANNVVVDNVFQDCGAVSLGAHPELRALPWWRFERNRLTNSQLRLRRSDRAELINNEMRGGTLKLGISSNPDDVPRNLRIEGTTFDGVEIDNNLRHAYTCIDTTMMEVTGDRLDCS